MNDIDEDEVDIMDDADEFDFSHNAKNVNDDQVPENKIESKSVGGDGVVGNKRAPCWKDFKIITPTGHLKPKAAYNLCVKSYACHSKNNGTTSLTHHLKN